MSMPGIGKAFGTTKLTYDTVESRPKSMTETFGALRNFGFGVASVYGGPTGAILASQNDLANFVNSGHEKDPTTRNMGMANSGASFIGNMLSAFTRTQPLGFAIGATQFGMSMALNAEMSNPGAYEVYKQDPMHFNTVTGGQ